jgi:hypothetical protein
MVGSAVKFKNQKMMDDFRMRYVLAGGDPSSLTTNGEYVEYLTKISDNQLNDELRNGLLPELCELEIKRRAG